MSQLALGQDYGRGAVVPEPQAPVPSYTYRLHHEADADLPYEVHASDGRVPGAFADEVSAKRWAQAASRLAG